MADHSTNGAAPLPAAGGSRRAVFVISLICAAQFVLQLDFSVVNVALPSIQRELGMPAAELQWIVTGYALAFGAPHDLLQTPPLLISQPPRLTGSAITSPRHSTRSPHDRGSNRRDLLADLALVRSQRTRDGN